MSRHIFRLTSYKNIIQFLSDGAIFAKNHNPMQCCFQTSYASIVDRRGSSSFTTPCGSNVNDFVPFYFSPITAMAYTIYKGNVDLKDLDGHGIGIAKSEKIVFLVSNTQNFLNSNEEFYFTNVACNSEAITPKYENDLSNLDTHVDWSLFDESPIKAKIPEIDYQGVCQYFQDRDDGLHASRNSKRMSEFMVKDSVSLSYIDCIITKNNEIKNEIERHINASQ